MGAENEPQLSAADLDELRAYAAKLPAGLKDRFRINSNGLIDDFSNAFTGIQGLCWNLKEQLVEVDEFLAEVDKLWTYEEYLETKTEQHNELVSPEDRVDDVVALVEKLSAVPGAKLMNDKIAEIKMFAVQHKEDLEAHVDELERMALEGADILKNKKEKEELEAALSKALGDEFLGKRKKT